MTTRDFFGVSVSAGVLKAAGFAMSVFMFAGAAHAEPAFKIGSKAYTVEDLAKEDAAAFYEIEKQKFELIDRLSQEKYLENFWQERAKKEGKSVNAVRDDYLNKNAKVDDKEIKATLDQFKDHPQLKKLPADEQNKQVRRYLEETKKREAMDGIIASARSSKQLVVTYPMPNEPVYKLTVVDTDPVRYGPEANDTKPTCKGDECALTIIEYSEFQCPFCVRVLPTVKRLMTEYKGKIRWIVRDFPLSFHDRARPAAVAARCAMEQGKYWEMYNALFENQRSLQDADFQKYAASIGLDKGKFDKCYKSPPAAITKAIDDNFETGQKYGVSGTPAFFINGRKLSGALPYEEFRRVIDDEMSKQKKS